MSLTRHVRHTCSCISHEDARDWTDSRHESGARQDDSLNPGKYGWRGAQTGDWRGWLGDAGGATSGELVRDIRTL